MVLLFVRLTVTHSPTVSVSRQRGSHIILTKENSIYTLSIPNKSILAPGLLRSLINKASLTIDEFMDLL
ncbi:MAG: type II toxin-antitoxin system HicA family toxin [Xenococcaceae cyanobacterium MO_188.B32]|nr:type II toxin-antitoxin system HicA family toxin [Xenococcaceae cyanobacterium MO_188.B32]